MATLVLGAFGTLVGGPIGGALGALVGRQVDAKIIGSGSRDGPRLRDLAVTTSSYGIPIPAHFGTIRSAGSIIWSTELRETREKSGGGKGQPSTTQYSYSASFAVALSSRPIIGIGRIWADGNLLRGAAGDLKTGGNLRIYHGHGDQVPDPLIEAAQNGVCPAFRGLAYCVFEDLHLGDFGNRIPALTFEVIAAAPDQSTLFRDDETISYRVSTSGLEGFSHEGGSYADMLDQFDTLFPLSLNSAADTLLINDRGPTNEQLPILSEPTISTQDDEFALADGVESTRDTSRASRPGTLRYYDTTRDYLPGIQRVDGRATNDAIQIEFAGAIAPDAARRIINEAARRADHGSRRIRYRTSELNGSIMPGAQIRVAGMEGQWFVEEWEWRDSGVELTLSRLAPLPSNAQPGARGSPALPEDVRVSGTVLHAFELPWDGTTATQGRVIYAALSGEKTGWRGATLYRDVAGGLEPIGPSGTQEATIGQLTSPLPPSPALVLEHQSNIEINLLRQEQVLTSTTPDGLANGKNRLLIGNEIVQFLAAERITQARWRLTGLLRGRGATESASLIGQPSGTKLVVLDENLVRLPYSDGDSAILNGLAAIGLGDPEPVYSLLHGTGSAEAPLHPVHPAHRFAETGHLHIQWTRRSRGSWTWPAQTDVALNEESERYLVGIGNIDNPTRSWETSEPQLVIDSQQLAAESGHVLWVRQIGRGGISAALSITSLP